MTSEIIGNKYFLFDEAISCLSTKIVLRMRNKINLALIYIFAFFSGFANMPYTKIAGILFFVYIAVFLVFYNWRHKQNAISFNTKQYFWFVIFSVPALFVGLFFLRFDALYFFIYSLLPLLLYYTLPPQSH